MPQIKFAETLGLLLEATAFSRKRKEVASEVGVSISALSQYVTGKAVPGFQTLVKLARVLDVSLDFLVFGSSSSEPHAQDYHPAVRYIDNAVAHLQATTDRQTRIFGRLASALSAELKLASERLAHLGVSQGGIVTDRELTIIEGFSLSTDIVSLNLDADVVGHDSDAAAGPFLPVVASNLSRGRKYRFLLVRQSMPWQKRVAEYRSLLSEACGGEHVLGHCQFREADSPIVSGCGFYRLDGTSFEAAEPVLWTRFEEWISEGWLGFSIAASSALQADSLMDPAHLTNGLMSFKALWKDARPL